MMASRRARWTHEINAKTHHRVFRGFFLHAKDFGVAHEVAAEAWESPPKTIRWFKMSSTNGPMFSRSSRNWKFLYSCFHLVSTSAICDASINLCHVKKFPEDHTMVRFGVEFVSPSCPFLRPSWWHLVWSCRLRLLFMWSSVPSGSFRLTKTIRRKQEGCLIFLCWRHTLPKLTQDGNTNIEIFNFGSDRENIRSFVRTS